MLSGATPRIKFRKFGVGMSDKIDFALLAHKDVVARPCKKGEIIFREGDPASDLFPIQRGQVENRRGNRLLATFAGNNIFLAKWP
jgi:hypothetical protein